MTGASHTRSHQLFAEALEYIPGGVNSPVRAFRAVGGEPFFVNRARGSRVYDVDGNEYIDYVCTWGPAILGHAHPAIINAVKEAAEAGTSFAIGGKGADVQFRDGSHHVRDSAGARVYPARQNHQVRWLLSRPCRFVAG